MKPFIRHTGLVAPLDRNDVDTDQIIPKQFLKRVERAGYGRFLFHGWRYDEGGAPVADFVLNRPEFAGVSILVTGSNFGCGSSREHAAWALAEFGFRVIVAPSFADIFRENADQNGLLCVALPEEEVRSILTRARNAPLRLTVDLQAMTVSEEGTELARFTMDPFRRRCLMQGLDRIGLALEHVEAIAAYEGRRHRYDPTPASTAARSAPE